MMTVTEKGSLLSALSHHNKTDTYIFYTSNRVKKAIIYNRYDRARHTAVHILY
jgi:hypothetical protein